MAAATTSSSSNSRPSRPREPDHSPAQKRARETEQRGGETRGRQGEPEHGTGRKTECGTNCGTDCGTGCGEDRGAPGSGPGGARCASESGKGLTERERRPLGSEKRQQQQQKQQPEESEEDEEEEEEEEDEDEEEGKEECRALPQDADDEAGLEASRDNDSFLEHFARELDGASSCEYDEDEDDDDDESESKSKAKRAGEEAGGEGQVGQSAAKGAREDDEQIAWALQVSGLVRGAVVYVFAAQYFVRRGKQLPPPWRLREHPHCARATSCVRVSRTCDTLGRCTLRLNVGSKDTAEFGVGYFRCLIRCFCSIRSCFASTGCSSFFYRTCAVR